jgi:hypothetical protein
MNLKNTGKLSSRTTTNSRFVSVIYVAQTDGIFYPIGLQGKSKGTKSIHPFGFVLTNPFQKVKVIG